MKKNRILIVGSASSGADFVFEFLSNHPDVIPSLKSRNPLNLNYNFYVDLLLGAFIYFFALLLINLRLKANYEVYFFSMRFMNIMLKTTK